VARIARARAEAGVAPLAYDAVLERVGNLHCRTLVDERAAGHFSLSGVPPYLRYALAGGVGFHRENVASFSTTAPVAEPDLPAILFRSVEDMLAERPPNDGHRKALLDPWASHLGVGVGWVGGEVRMTHELATIAADRWEAPALLAAPGTPLALSGHLAWPWQLAAVEVQWEPPPTPRSRADLQATAGYSYPPQRSFTQVAGRSGDESRLRVDRLGTFTYRWVAGPRPGVELVVVWAHPDTGSSDLIPVALSATVVTGDGRSTPALAPWLALGALVGRAS
jgi:hypothetical protein